MSRRKVIQPLISQLKAHFEAELAQAADPGDVQAIERALLMYRFLPIVESPTEASGKSEVIAPGSLVKLSIASRQSWVFMVPQHGGLVTDFEGLPLQVLTPQSPLGELLLGRKAGDSIQVATRTGAERTYEVVSVI